jgi:hypothetical protein
MKNGKIANINTNLKGLFNKWLSITKPFHKLSPQEQDVLALILYYNHIYKDDINNEKLRWKFVFDYDTRRLIKDELDIKNAGFGNILTSLRKQNIIKDGRVVSTYIPNLSKNADIFKVIFSFKIIKDE